MTLDEIDALLSTTQTTLAPFEVPAQERDETIKQLEIGQYPGDEPDRYLKAGRKEFEALKTERAPLVEQVGKARAQEQEFRDRESTWGQIKQFGQQLLAPHEVVTHPNVTNTPGLVTNPPEKSFQSAPSSRFHVDEGEIIDTHTRQVITPEAFNRLSTPDEKTSIQSQLQASGLLEIPEDSKLPASASPPMTPEALPYPTPRSRGIDQRTGLPIPVLKQEPIDYLSVERVPQIVREQGGAGLVSAIDSLGAALRHYQAHPEQASPTNWLAMKVREWTGRDWKLDLVTPMTDLLASVSNALRSSKAPLTPESVPELVAAGVTRFATETVPELAVLRALTGNMALAFGAHGLIKGSMFEDEQGKPVFEGLNMHGALSGLVNLATIGILHGLAPTSRAIRAGAGAIIGGGVTAAQGGTPEQSLADAITFAAMSGIAPGNPQFMAAWRAQRGMASRPGRPDPTDVTPKTGIPGPEPQRAGPEGAMPKPAPTKPSGSVASSPFAPPPKPKPLRTPEDLSGIPGTLQIRPPGPPTLFKRAAPPVVPPPMQPAPAMTPEAVPSSPPLPLPPVSVPEMAPPSPEPVRQAVTPEALMPGAAPMREEEPVLELPEVTITPEQEEGDLGMTPFTTGGAPSSEELYGEPAAPTVEDVHALADQRGIPWDNAPEFMNFTQQITGKKHLDDLSPEELTELMAALKEVEPFRLQKKPAKPAQTPESLPPSRKPMVTLYRGESVPDPSKIPAYVKADPRYQQIERDVRGRWFTDDPAIAQWYKKEAGETGRITTLQMSKDEAEQYRVTNQPAEVQRYSKDQEREYFVPHELAATATDLAAHEAATSPTNVLPEPTKPMKEAGNYQKGHVAIAGLDISIENPQGSTRSGVDKSGKPWSQTMKDHYGYIRGTKGKDKDHIDVFIKPGTPEDYSEMVYVVDQQDPNATTFKFDEHKIVMGASSMKEAKNLYEQNYARGWRGTGPITAMDMASFKNWLNTADHTRPAHQTFKPVAETPEKIEYTIQSLRPGATPETLTLPAKVPPEKPKNAPPERRMTGKEANELMSVSDRVRQQYGMDVWRDINEQARINKMTTPERIQAFKDFLEKRKPSTPASMFLQMEGREKRYPVASYQEASEKVRQVIEAADLGASQTPTVSLMDATGKIIGHVSYNGRVWAGQARDWTKETKLLYESRTTPEALPPPKQSEAAKALLSGRGGQLPDIDDKKTAASIKLAGDMADILNAGNKIGTELFDRADTYFGGTQAEGAYTPKDAYDAMELGINRYLMEKGGLGVRPGSTVASAQETVRWIRSHILDKLPAQTRRTEEQNEFQQFSTPPDLALVMNWAANVKGKPMTNIEGVTPQDVVLEPSVGLGGLAVFAENEGARVIVNELSPRRAALVKTLGFDQVFTENAEQLHNILPKEIKPTVVLMNPPFTSTAGRIEGQRKTANVFAHLEQALKRLQPGGRLVALIGKGKMYADPQVLEEWIADTAKQYAYRARIGLTGKGYAKYGTSYSNQILIFDKVTLPESRPVIANVEDVLDAIPLLKEVRDARHYGPLERTAPHELAPAQPTGEAVSETGPAAARPERPISPAARPVGPRQQEGRPPESPVAGKRAAVTRQPADVEAGGRAQVSEREPGRPPQPIAPAAATPKSDVAQTRGPARVERAGSAPDRGSERGLSAEQVSAPLTLTTAESAPAASTTELTDSVYDSYVPKKALIKGSKPHPGKLVESSALAAVDAPDVTYRPSIPQALIDRAELSAAQLEPIVYAGEAHQHILPSGERKGFLIGDGPGVGKGRTLAGIILDNWRQGRKKALWLSETQNLVNAAVRDWKALAQKESDIFGLNKYSRDQPIDRKDGILYTTYTTMASGLETMSGGGLKAKQAKGEPIGKLVDTRLDQTLAWLGPDFDGVLIFDEAHNMQNSLEREGERGDIAAAAKALASVLLQQRLPKARIVYSSATAATRVDALAFADRLGLWGEGTPFPTKGDFVQSIESSGLGAMEIVAQNMKAMGAYLSRNLDYSDVKYRKLEHVLTPAQEEVYNAMAQGWQVVLQNLDKALELIGITGQDRSGQTKTRNARAKGAAYGKFWGANQRFFNQILTSMQLPSVVTDIRTQLDAGHSVLVQLVNTNEAIMQRQLEAAEQSGQDLDSVDMTPRQNLMQYIEHAFPTAQFEEYTEPPSTTIKSRLVLDSQGRPVENADAVELKNQLLERMGSMRVPEGSLEILINTFGPKMVAEVTGRAERVVRVKDEDEGTETVQRQKRTPAMVKEDVAAFMEGKKRILIFSDKGGTGESYHADNTKKNRQQRVHYLLQPGWRADKAVQGLGRSHRTNQASAPEYVLTMTNIKGHKRFISTIARRLDQLGALTKGQRQAGSSGLIEAKDNLENRYASGAVRQFFLDMYHGQAGQFHFADITKKLGLNNLIDKDGALLEERLPGVPQFMNRVLALELADQNALFDQFMTRMERAVEIATQQGTLDTGMETYRADGGIRLLTETEIYRDPLTKAPVMLGHYEAQHSVDFVPVEAVEARSGFSGFVTNRKTGKAWAKMDSSTRTTDEGRVISLTKLQSPVQGQAQYVEAEDLDRLYAPLSKAAGRTDWEQQITEHAPYRTEKFYVVTGNMLRIWDRLPHREDTATKVRRIQTVDGKKVLGIVLHETAAQNFLVKLGKGEKKAPELSAGEAFDAVLDEGATLKLANDWQIKRATVNREPRLEIVGDNLYAARDQLKGYGAFVEQVQYATRYFIPTEKAVGERVIEKILKYRPIIDIIRKGAKLLGEERGSIPVSPFTGPKFGKEAKAYRKQRAGEELRGFSSSDDDIEARVRAAKLGVKPEGIWSRVKAHTESVWHLVSREFEHLPDTAEFAPLRTDLLRLAKSKGLAADQVQRELAAIIKPLSRKQYDQFEWKALLADLAREAQQDRALPFGYTKEKVQDDLERLDQVIERDPLVQAAWAKRQALWTRKKAEYQSAMDRIGFDTTKKLTKEDYFRHQVLEHARERYLKGTGSKVRTPTGRGFLKARHGSTLDINANYVQAEFEVMAQMVYDTEVAKVIAHVDRDLNIRRSLEQDAKARNADAVQRLIDEGGTKGAIVEATLKDFRNRIGMHMGMARKALDLEKHERISLAELAEFADDLESPANLSARGVFKAISERKQYIRDLLGAQFKTWDQLIPDTHDVWQPREGNVFYMADSIPAHLAKALQEGLLEEAGLTQEKLRKVLAMGNAREQYVIPNEAKATLDDLSHKQHSWFVEANRHLLSHWKQLMLIAPRKLLRYNTRNLSGDADALFVGNPRAFLKLKQAAKELVPVIFKDTVLMGEAKEWADRGGYGTTLQWQELGDLNDLKAFKASLEKQSQGSWLSAPAAVWNTYWKGARLSTDYREALMRYAAYLDYLEQMQQSPKGRPKNFGASIPQTVMALTDVRDRAFKLSNELIGAYDRVSVAGQTLRSFWIPFWSWNEVNATRYGRLVRNADPALLARMAGVGAKKATFHSASFLIKLALFWSMLQAWNYLMHGDDEEELHDTNPIVANRPHILFGRDEQGKILYLAGIGALGDLLSWLGMDAAPGLVGDVLHDRLTVGEAIKNVAKAPVNKIWQGLTPMVKLPLELAVRESTYPDVFHPRPIQDRADYLAQQFTIGPEVGALRGKPGRPLFGGEDLTGLLVQRTDPLASAYGTWQGIERKYLERMGKDSPAAFWRTPRGEALSNWSRAIKENDLQAEARWKAEYERMEREKYGLRFSQTKMMADIEKSLRAKAPLAGVTKAERAQIVQQLDAQERRTLEKAETYYKDVILQVLPESRRRALTSRLQYQGWLSRPSAVPHELTP